MTVSRTRNLADTETYITNVMTRIEERSYLPYLIVENPTGNVTGFIDIKNIDWSIPKAELGCFADAAYAGKGNMKIVFKDFVDHCLHSFGFMKLYLRTHEENRAARGIAEHAGFKIEGRMSNDSRTTDGRILDMLYYGRTPQK